ncbi:MAG TPA: hypothetical protein VLS88_06750 [Polyangiales bacterium]|nr:hypothetical protein [Polyangiales bacterium]
MPKPLMCREGVVESPNPNAHDDATAQRRYRLSRQRVGLEAS